jgi:hypothetical protein
LRGAVDVGVEQADLEAVDMQREREVDRGRRLADTALAAGDRDDVLDAGERQPAAAGLAARLSMCVAMTVCLGRAGRTRGPRRCLRRGAMGGQHDSGGQHPWQIHDRLLGGFAHRLHHRRLGRIDLDREADMAFAHGEAAHHAGAHEVAALRQPDAAEGVEDLGFGDGHA